MKANYLFYALLLPCLAIGSCSRKQQQVKQTTQPTNQPGDNSGDQPFDKNSWKSGDSGQPTSQPKDDQAPAAGSSGSPGVAPHADGTQYSQPDSHTQDPASSAGQSQNPQMSIKLVSAKGETLKSHVAFQWVNTNNVKSDPKPTYEITYKQITSTNGEFIYSPDVKVNFMAVGKAKPCYIIAESITPMDKVYGASCD